MLEGFDTPKLEELRRLFKMFISAKVDRILALEN